MEFREVGSHCEADGCGQKDFLPFTCKYCNQCFCLTHRSPSDHKCGQEPSTGVREGAGATKQKDQAKVRCVVKGCKERKSFDLHSCKFCGHLTCLSHRLHWEHPCNPDRVREERDSKSSAPAEHAVSFTVHEHTGQCITLPAHCSLLRAFFGDSNRPFDVSAGADVTEEVRKLLSTGGKLEASIALFGDPLPGVPKALIVEAVEKEVEKATAAAGPSKLFKAFEYSGEVISIPQGFELVRAFYGDGDQPFDSKRGQDVTAKAAQLLASGGKLEASNAVFGDPLPGHVKCLTVEVRPKAVEKEVEKATVAAGPSKVFKAFEYSGEVISIPQGFELVRAFYGDGDQPFDSKRGQDVTAKAAQLLASGGKLEASNAVFGDPLAGHVKCLTVEVRPVAAAATESTQPPIVHTYKAHEHTDEIIRLPAGFKIKRAFYGDGARPFDASRGKDVTETARAVVARGGVLQPNNDIFGDPLPGAVKCLVVEAYQPVSIAGAPAESEPLPNHVFKVYQRSGKAVQLPAGFQLHRAFYGDPNHPFDAARGADVTQKARDLLAKGRRLEARDELFGDPLPGVVKALVVEATGTKPAQSKKRKKHIFKVRERSGQAVQLPARLEILRAFYGHQDKPWDMTQGADVTARAKELRREGMRLEARNELFGDPLPGVAKCLVVECYDRTEQSETDQKQAAASNQTTTAAPVATREGFVIKRAFYGNGNRPFEASQGAEVTDLARAVVAQRGTLAADNNIYGDPLPGHVKTLVVEACPAAALCSEAAVARPAVVAQQLTFQAQEHSGQAIDLPPGYDIKGAFYGDPNHAWDVSHGADVTEQAKPVRARGGKLEANNALWGDPVPGVGKALIISAAPSLAPPTDGFTE
eukprot:g52718.t1